MQEANYRLFIMDEVLKIRDSVKKNDFSLSNYL